jgi:hypothetical protein
MISITKPKAPQFLNSETVDLAVEKLNEFYAGKDRKQKRYNFPFNKEIDQRLKEQLHKIFFGKCGYCEIRIENAESGYVDRYRPNTGVRDKNDYFRDLYWWLTFEWDNFIYCCKECNQYKANYFPIKGIRAFQVTDSLTDEKPLLLSPYYKNVEDHFTYKDGRLNSESDEGIQTIELLNLNRSSLINRRKIATLEISSIVDRMSESIGRVSPLDLDYLNSIFARDPKIEFLFAKHEHLLSEMDLNPFLGNVIDKENINPSKAKTKVHLKEKQKEDLIKSDYFPIEYIEIVNFKSIDHIKINFPVDELNQNSWVTLLGENGLGKSSILQAFCLGVYPDLSTGDRSVSDLIKTGKQEACIIVKQRDSENVLKTTLIRQGDLLIHEGQFFSPLIGYGSVRLLPDIRLKASIEEGKIRYKNLFDPLVPLNDILDWLKAMFNTDRGYFDLIAVALKELLPKEIDDDLTIENGNLIFLKSRIPYKDLSDGYKGTIALALDIMKTLSDGKTDIDKLSGIVVIDELGNQLHPRWQMSVVRQLKKAFPKVTFIVSTHHPLCLRGLRAGEVIVLNKTEDKQIHIAEDLPDPSDMRVDQILASEFFGLNSLVDPEIEANFNLYYKLLGKGSNVTSEDKENIDKLRDLLRNRGQMGGSLREELMYTVIDKLLAQKVSFDKKPLSKQEFKDQLVNRVRSMWKSLNIGDDDQH